MKSNNNNNIKYGNTVFYLICTIIIAIIICIMISNFAFKNGMITCDNYILNTYLYIILAILLIFIIILLNDKTGCFNNLVYLIISSNKIISFAIIISILLALNYALFKTNPKNVIVSNIIWFLIMFMIGIILIPIIIIGNLNNVAIIAGVITILITIITGLISYYYSHLINYDWDKYLDISLYILIILLLLGSFFVYSKNIEMFVYAISILSIIIFTLLLLSNGKKIKENAEKCVDGKDVPNYPLESYSMILNIVNIFQNLIYILGGITKNDEE